MQSEESAVCEDFVSAKVRGMRSKLLEADRLKALADCRSLRDLFQRIYPDGRFEGHLVFERGMLADHARNLDLIGRFLSGAIGEVYAWLMVQFHLENLKVALRGHVAGLERAEVEPLTAPLPDRLRVPMERLFEGGDPRRFAEDLPVSEFRDIVRDALKAEERPDLFRLEMALDAAYSRRLLLLARPCGEWARQLVAFDVAVRTVFLVLRARVVYRLDAEAIEEFAVPAPGRLSREALARLMEAGNLAEAVHALPSALLQADARRSALSLAALEDALHLRHYRLGIRCFAECILDLAAVVAYFYIKRIEFVNLLRVAEGVRHSLPRDEIEARLLTAR